ncbi:MAG: ABC transporter permease, partial [Nitrososphaerales archaeon]
AMPAWIADVSSVNPISISVNAIRALAITGSYSTGTVVEAFVIIAGIAVVTMGATLYLFRKVVS